MICHAYLSYYHMILDFHFYNTLWAFIFCYVFLVDLYLLSLFILCPYASSLSSIIYFHQMCLCLWIIIGMYCWYLFDFLSLSLSIELIPHEDTTTWVTIKIELPYNHPFGIDKGLLIIMISKGNIVLWTNDNDIEMGKSFCSYFHLN